MSPGGSQVEAVGPPGLRTVAVAVAGTEGWTS